MPDPLKFILGLTVVLTAVVMIARRFDVRLVLFLAALALGGIAGDIWPVVRTFLTTLSSEQFVIPICTAMGFAHVLRHSACDQHLVHLLVRPLRRVRPLLIPGAVVVGFIVNMSVISQASTAVAVGTVLVPLLRSAQLSPTTIGSALLLGSSLGGELLNPGAPELNTVARATGVDASECVPRVLPLLLIQLATATAAFWFFCIRVEAGTPAQDNSNGEPIPGNTFRVNLLKAAVPIVPLLVLMIVGPPLNLVYIPRTWLMENNPLTDFRADLQPAKVPEFNRLLAEREQGAFGSRLIGASMVFGALLAALAAPGSAPQSARVFFEGAGVALTRIISVIVVAQCFGTGIKQLNLDEPIRGLILVNPNLVWALAGVITLAFAALCGSGMAATQSLFAIYINGSMSMELMLRIGAVTAIAAAAGRTMSPVAAVVLTCASLTESQPLAIVRRVALPLLAGSLVTVLVAWLRGG